jgi:CHASE2 domain-containing sensor protein
MSTRRASEPVSIVVGSALLCACTLATGWLVLRGGSFVAAIPAMGAFTFVFVELLTRAPRVKR